MESSPLLVNNNLNLFNNSHQSKNFVEQKNLEENINYGTVMPSTSSTELNNFRNDETPFADNISRINEHSAVITLSSTDETLNIYGYKTNILKTVIYFFKCNYFKVIFLFN